MFTLGSKAVVLNDLEYVTINGSVLSITGFGQFDNTDPAFSVVGPTPTLGVPTVYSSVDLAAAGFVAGKEIAIYWQNLKYIGDGVLNMSSSPQQPMCIIWPATNPNLTTIAQVWEHRQEGLGISTLFNVTGTILTSLNPAVNIISTSIRDIIAPQERWDKPDSGFMYGGFGGTDTTPGGLIPGSTGTGNGWQVEASVRTASPDAMDPYSDKAHGSQEVILNDLYSTYAFVVNTTYEGVIPYALGNVVADQLVKNKPIEFRIYANQTNPALIAALTGWIGVAPA